MNTLDTIAMWSGYIIVGLIALYILMDLWVRIHFVLCYTLANIRAARFLHSRIYWWRIPRSLWHEFLETYKPWSRDGAQWSKDGRRVHWSAPPNIWGIGKYDFQSDG